MLLTFLLVVLPVLSAALSPAERAQAMLAQMNTTEKIAMMSEYLCFLLFSLVRLIYFSPFS
jgi:hypothetical protein